MAGLLLLQKFKDVRSFDISPLRPCNLLLPGLCKNPSYKAEEIDKWSIEFLGLKSHDVERKRELVSWKLGLASSLCYPTLSPKHFTLIAKFIAWLFLVDDIGEDLEVSPSDVKNMTKAYIKIFKGEYEEAKSLIRSKEMLRQMDMFHAVWEELTSSMKCFPRNRFVQGMKETMKMMRLESDWTRDGILPNVETYLWMRRVSSGVKPCLAAVDGLQSLDVDDASPDVLLIVQKLDIITIHHIALGNDIQSLRKEWVSGHYLNIVPILAFHHGCSLDEAIIIAAKMVEDLGAEFAQVASSAELSTSSQGVKDYVQGLVAWMKGSCEWGSVTGRYHES